MKMLFASDSFKGSLTAVEICDLLHAGSSGANHEHILLF